MDLPNISPVAGLSIAAIFAAIGAFWSQSKAFARYLSGFLLLQKTITSGLTMPVGRHIRRRYRKAPTGLSKYRGVIRQIDDQTVNSFVPFEMPNSVGIWWGRRGIFIVNAQSDLMLMSLRWFSDPEKLVVDALEDAQAERMATQEIGAGNFYVQRIVGTAGDYRGDDSGTTIRRRRSNEPDSAPAGNEQSNGDMSYWSVPDIMVDKSFMYTPERYIQNKKPAGPFHGLFFDEPALAVVESVKQWFTREEWYRQHGIPWRTGVLFHGPGGTGKSSLARCLAQLLGIPLYQFYLNTLTDREFLQEWDGLSAPCVVALEDFDTVFHGREPVTIHKSLSFECVLNSISGISSASGILLVVTTNHLEHVDEALGRLDKNGRPTRPGRIDHILYMGNTTVKQRQDIARFTLNGWADDLIENLVSQGEGTTAAQFQFMCVSAALDRLKDQKHVGLQ